MAKINLLPWREERRQELKQEFLVVLGGVAVIAAGLVFLAKSYYDGEISDQNSRNQYLQTHINELNRQVEEIRELEKKKRELLERRDVIQGLQGKRPVIVRVFDEVVRTLPDGVFYQSLDRKSQKINVSGIAESNNRISSLMRKLDTSEWFSEPNLSAVKADEQFGEQASSFSLSFNISTPASKKEGDN
jgi:type IV pilus assembly protein PilN